jgi:hypothetical protein
VAGFALVYFLFPTKDAEEALLQQYAEEDQAARLADTAGTASAT